MDLYRLRVEVPDVPGRVGRVLVALGRLAVNVVEVDCHNVDGDVRLDDLFVHATRSLDVPAIARAVEESGGSLVQIRPISVHDLEDPVTRCMRLVAHVAAPTVSDDVIAWCAGELVRADLACVIDARFATRHSAAGFALVRGLPVHLREWVERLPTVVQPWVLAVPFDRGGRRAAAVVVRGTSRFTRTETARLRALLDAASRRAGSSGPAEPSENAEFTWDFH